MVPAPIKVAFWGFIITIIGAGIASTFVPQLKPTKRDFTIRKSDKQYAESLPKDKYMKAIRTVVDSDKPFYGSKHKKD